MGQGETRIMANQCYAPEENLFENDSENLSKDLLKEILENYSKKQDLKNPHHHPLKIIPHQPSQMHVCLGRKRRVSSDIIAFNKSTPNPCGFLRSG